MKTNSVKTFLKSGWKKGIDTQNDVFGDEDFNAFRELTNFILEPGGTLVPRPPFRQRAVVDTNTQGMLYARGVFYVFAKLGDTVAAHSGMPASILYFDPPEYTSTWTLLDQGVYQNAPYAIIRHTYTSSRFASRIFLHVWDGKPGLPTYSQDPFGPFDWGPNGLPTDSYGSTNRNTTWKDYTPVSNTAVERIFMSGVNGNHYFSGIGRARVWNPYDAATIEKVGLPYYFYGRNDGSINSMLIPEPFSYMAVLGKYASYVGEQLNGDGTWTKLIESDPYGGGFGGPGYFKIATALAPWANAVSEVTRVYFPSIDNTLFRLRVNVLPEIAIVSGATLNPDGATVVGAGTITYEGAVYTSTALLKSSLSNSNTYYVGVRMVGGVAVGYAWNITDTTIQQGALRYGFYILATVAVDGGGGLTTTVFQYPNLKQESWYVQKHNTNLNYWAGSTETGFLNSSSHDVTGQNITAVQAVKNRLMICYSQDTQLWAVDAAAANNSFIDRYDFGTVNQTTLFYNRPVICTQRGIRAFDLTGLNFQSLEDMNIGEAVQNLGKINVISCTFWPWFGSYVAFCKLSETANFAVGAKLPMDSVFRGDEDKYGFLILSYSKEAEVACWSWCPVEGLTDIYAKMVTVDSSLYVRSGNKIYNFDADPSLSDGLRITDDITGAPFVCRFITQFANMGRPGTFKRLVSINFMGTGKCTFQHFMNPWQDNAEAEVGAQITEMNIGKRKAPLSGTGVGLSLMCTTETGARVIGFTVDYVPLGK